MGESSTYLNKLLKGDISVFAIPAQLTDEDKRSLLSIQKALCNRNEKFAYLEIGSHLGGSLQTYLVDPRCTKIYSIDKRPGVIPDERGIRDCSAVTTQKMLDSLHLYYKEYMWKIQCFERDSSDVDKSKIEERPLICFIDGEHTDDAAFRDFLFCTSVAKFPSVVVFDDTDIVFRGIERSLNYLEDNNIPYYAYNLPNYICVVEVGQLGLFRDEALLERLLMSERAIIENLKKLARYRDFYGKLNRHPLYILARKVRNFIRGREGA